MVKVIIPDLNKIVKFPKFKTTEGLRTVKGFWDKGRLIAKTTKTQATLPKDKNLLKKLGIRKGDKILAIAAYYGDWADALGEDGAKVCYSDISKSLVNWARENLKNIESFICCDFVSIPRKKLEFDWTFSFEPVGAGLPVAMLRSLLNKKGGILVVYVPRFIKRTRKWKTGRNLFRIINCLSKTYECRSQIERIMIEGTLPNGEKLVKPHIFGKIFTNKLARERANFDLALLGLLKNKRRVSIKKLMNISKAKRKKIERSMNRLNRISKLLEEKFRKNVLIENA